MIKMVSTERVEKKIRGNIGMISIFALMPIMLCFLLFNDYSTGSINLEDIGESSNIFKAGLGICAFFLGIFYDRVYLSRSRNIRRISVKWTREFLSGIKGSGDRPYYDSADIEELISSDEHTRNIIKLESYYTSSIIVQSSFLLSCSVSGYLIARSTENPIYFFPYIFLTYVGFILILPTYNKIEALVADAEQSILQKQKLPGNSE